MITIIASISPKTREKIFFEDIYSIKDIENWDGNVSYFEKFKDRLELFFEVSQV